MENKVQEKRCEITRRHALHVMVEGGLVLIGGLLLEKEAGAAPRWVQAGTVSQFRKGVPRRVKLPDGQVVFILRQDNTRWQAISALCTHEGAEVQWNRDLKRFVCPLHGATFSANGQNPKGPARRPLAVSPVSIKGQNVLVDAAKSPAGSGKKTGGKKHHEEDEEDEHEHRGRRHREDDDD